MTCCGALLCDNLKCETRDAAANPDCQAQRNQEVWYWMGPTAKLCFPPCKRVVSVRKRKQECSIPQQHNGSYFSFPCAAQKCRNTTSQVRWWDCDFKQGAQLHLNVKVFVRLHVMHLKLFIHNSFQLSYLRRQGIWYLLHVYYYILLRIRLLCKYTS